MFWEYSDCFLNLGVSSMLHHRFQAAYIILESAAHFLGVESSIHIFWWVIVLEILDISCYWLTFGFWMQIRENLNSAVNISYGCLSSGIISFVKTCWIYLQCSLVKLWSTFRLLIWRFVHVKISLIWQIDACCPAGPTIVVLTLDTKWKRKGLLLASV